MAGTSKPTVLLTVLALWGCAEAEDTPRSAAQAHAGHATGPAARPAVPSATPASKAAPNPTRPLPRPDPRIPIGGDAYCQQPEILNNFPCDDGDACTSFDRCVNDECVGVPWVQCKDGAACYEPEGTCDPATGECSYALLAPGTVCQDGNPCTGWGACYEGSCEPGSPVFDGASCVLDELCAPATCYEGVCVADPLPAPGEGVSFTDVTGEAGVSWYASDPQLISAGAAVLDFDTDGWPDLLLLNAKEGQVGMGLFQNQGDGTFADVTEASGLAVEGAFTAAAAADFDNDGDPDLYLASKEAPNLMFRNDAGVFSAIPGAAGAAGGDEWSTALAVADYDRDGHLDIFVGNYVENSKYPFHDAWPNQLYRNQGDGTFADVSAHCGVAGAGTTLSVTWTDHDGDGWLDLWVVNDFGQTVEPNQLFKVRPLPPGLPESPCGKVQFRDVAPSRGAATEIFGMGVTVADIDRDGDLDYYMSNLGDNVLLESSGGTHPTYQDIAAEAGVLSGTSPCNANLLLASWSVLFEDFDRDGWPDLYVSNGYIPAAADIANEHYSPNNLYLNNGASAPGTFTEVNAWTGVADQRRGRGARLLDYDRDGDLDILQLNVVESPLLLRNDTVIPGLESPGWLRLGLVGTRSARDAFGARVIVHPRLEDPPIIEELSPFQGYGGTSEAAVFVGLGALPDAEHVEVRWPSGVRQRLVSLATGAHTLVEPTVTVHAVELAPTLGFGGKSVAQLTVLSRAEEATLARISLRLVAEGMPEAAAEVQTPVLKGAQTLSLPIAKGHAPHWVTGDAHLVVRVETEDGARDERAHPVVLTE